MVLEVAVVESEAPLYPFVLVSFLLASQRWGYSRSSTYPLLTPLGGVPDDVVALFVLSAQRSGVHMLVLRQPHLQLLVPSPVAVIPTKQSS